MAIKVLIIDDEQGMRTLLRKIIEKIEGYEIVGEACNGEDGVQQFFDKGADVVFVDIEMPGVNGVECAKRILDINPKTILIFATAFVEYMDKAFELYAFDYILKPFKVDRVFKTLNKIKSQWKTDDKTEEKLIIKNKEQTHFIDKEDIILVQKEESLTAIYTKNNKYTSSLNLSELEEKLPRNIFLRCHKSYIINSNKIESIQSYGRWTYIIKLTGIKQDALITKEKYVELKEKFDY